MAALRSLALLASILAGVALLPAVAVVAETMAVRTDLTPKDLARVEAVTEPTSDFSKPEAFEQMQGGGGTTTKLVNRDSFSQVSANQDFAGEDTFKLGNALFRKFWVSSPSSTEASDGLGPLFNARSCQSCHLKDGRGHPPTDGEAAVSMFLRLSVPAHSEDERKALAERTMLRIPEPTYGGQLQNFAVPGVEPEGQMTIRYDERSVTLGDGTLVPMRHPTYGVADLKYGPLAPDVRLSPRVAPPMIGLGLVEAIAPEDILAHADPEDRDGDGISGKASLVRDPETGETVLGRFGWKASAPSIKVQSAEAFSGDIGISTPLVTDSFGECSLAQRVCRDAPSGVQPRLGEVEAPDPVLDLVTFYSQNLAVPARRDVGAPEVLKGKGLFYGAGCASCHTPKFVTSREALDKAQRFQLIWPYSDFLLHDMGDGLADGSTIGDAGPREWRTQPLWGIGLTKIVNGHTLFLHDGRARDLTEAILWHGGEAQASRDAYAAMDKADRDALHAFLESL
ncbi:MULTISPECIES: di-heme oxidoredictase family protein [unclassified Aureimonas]|uniref:di-heme oxidoreductase family protein n=1 Tax=unclassified Aureimonas TaxID=2615206 RepID=UPI000701092A|nr:MULTISPECIES: di-heme oxidoredictase family protein [unclassified Aureimonas]KQT66210.1 thiol oxidoreductase [Aureimonas sp. Leaf427]KQT72398.1 thiol oxidoreductase [Aureimonas sp. Leaf460]